MNPDLVVPLAVYDAEPNSARRAIHLLDYVEMAALPEAEWLVGGLLQTRSTALMFGKSNSFKSFLAIDIGLSVASGREWHGHKVVQGDVLFVATEGANGVGRHRIPVWFDARGVQQDDRRAYLLPKEIRLDVAAEVSGLIEAIHAKGDFRLLVLDIFGGTMAGSEVEDKTARAWVHGIQRILRETGASILTVAHTGWQDDTRARMHTHFWGSFDTRVRVEGDKNAMTATLTIDRHKDADSTGSWGFRMEQSAESLVPVFDALVKGRSARKLSSSQGIAMQALDDAIVANGVLKTGEDWPANSKIVTIEQWRVQFYRHNDGDTNDSKRQAFGRARKELERKGCVRFYDDCVWRCFDQ